MNRRAYGAVVATALGAMMMLLPGLSTAVPSFARQTGMNCATCHTVFPQLTPFGRMFKLNGYTMASGAFSDQSQQSDKLSEDAMAPLSAMLQADYTSMKDQDGAMPKDSVQLPQQFSIFYAGRISNYLGAFAQVSLDSGNNIAMDNTDVRYAKSVVTAGGMPITYGISLNNSPTVEDISNATSAWGFPFAGSDYANAPGYGTLLGTGTFAQTSAGAVAYAMVNNNWYGAMGAYHDTQVNGAGGAGLEGWAPYMRFAYQDDLGSSNFDIGAYTMNGKLTADVADATLPTAKFTDVGVDAQYQYLSGMHSATLRANYIQEKLSDAALVLGSSNDTLKRQDLSLNGEYYYDRMYGAALGLFANQGDADPLLYTDSLSTKPNSSGIMTELNYLPWLNTKLSLQYTFYSKFDGASSYLSSNTGAVRNAKSNNTLYASAWFLF